MCKMSDQGKKEELLHALLAGLVTAATTVVVNTACDLYADYVKRKRNRKDKDDGYDMPPPQGKIEEMPC